ncbi:MAG: hypothetical protein J6S69_11370 [Proteobacteria bacterium]|nr:hypothetical protein [Pseudomonadota bacterium]
MKRGTDRNDEADEKSTPKSEQKSVSPLEKNVRRATVRSKPISVGEGFGVRLYEESTPKGEQKSESTLSLSWRELNLLPIK